MSDLLAEIKATMDAQPTSAEEAITTRVLGHALAGEHQIVTSAGDRWHRVQFEPGVPARLAGEILRHLAREDKGAIKGEQR